MTALPDLPGVLSSDDVVASGAHLASLQTASGMIPWWPGGHCDPWNHVESAMALDVAGFHAEAVRAYRWLADIQRPDGAWHNYYLPDGRRDTAVEDGKLDTNVVAYVATGLWHHWRCTGDVDTVAALWPTVERALDFVLAHRRHDGLPLWAVEADGTRTWGYALLTGSSSIQHALRCGAAVGLAVGHERPDWVEEADVICTMIANSPQVFEPKTRWAMDWYYPVLTGAIEAEASLAYAAIGDFATATDLLAWTRPHRQADGSYLTGMVHPERIVFPDAEHSSYTAAAAILAADAISGASPACDLFVPATVRPA